MNVRHEFGTVDLILASELETRGVDAFALALIKAERQARKLFTYLVYQSDAFSSEHISALRAALTDNRRVYFDGFIRGIDALAPETVKTLLGSDYDALWDRIAEATRHRNKIFHGQLTGKELTRDDLVGLVADLRRWCTAVAEGAADKLGYDGFGRGSFRKADDPAVAQRLKRRFGSVAEYKQFISQYMES
jgi:hypothetical protein